MQRVTALLAVIGIAAGVAQALLPLPQPTSLSWCGPGATSDNAVVVKLNPNDVNSGSSAPTTAYQQAAAQAFVELCEGEANDVLVRSGVTIGGSLVIGAAGIWIFSPRRRT